jgi:hypothetical protein
MVYGRLRFGIRPRADLIIHHALGLVAIGCALYLHVGYGLALVTMITELLPVTTGLHGLGARLTSNALMNVAERLRLHVLAWLRLPLWGMLLLLVIGVWSNGRAADLCLAFVVTTCVLLALLALDLCWIRHCQKRIHRQMDRPTAEAPA